MQGGAPHRPQARERVLLIVDWLHKQGALETVSEADAFLAAAGMSSLRQSAPPEQSLLRELAQVAPPVPAQPPPALVPAPRRTNLPAPLISFVGRTFAFAEVTAVLLDHRLVTLTGAGGIGKTRLATEIGIGLVKDGFEVFPDGVWLVELAALSEPAFVAQTIARVFDLPEQAGRDPLDALRAHLAGKRLLLILDNCEHLIDACAQVVQSLLQHCWQLRILATSREPLGLPGEYLYPVPPLALPDPAGHALRSDAGRLFLDRMEGGQQSPRRWEDDAAYIDTICRKLDGIPLALELAASWAQKMTLAELAGGLNDAMLALRTPYRVVDPRHQTMRNALLWSYQLLTPAGQRLLARVSVFAGGWTLDAAEAICRDEPVVDIRSGLDELMDKSMVLVEDRTGRLRYRLLEPVRQFAQEQLKASGEEPEIRDKHARYYFKLAEQLYEVLDTPEEQVLLPRLDSELGNLRLVNVWALEGREVEFALRFNGYLMSFWVFHWAPAEPRYWLDAALALLPAERTRAILVAEALALEVAGYLTISYKPEHGQRYFERELVICSELDDPLRIAQALRGCGFAAMARGDLAQAQAYTGRSLIVSREAGDSVGATWSLFDLGYFAFAAGDYVRASTLLSEALPAFRAQGTAIRVSRCLATLSLVMKARGELEQARGFCEEALRIDHTRLYDYPMCQTLDGIAGVFAGSGNPIRAAQVFGFRWELSEARGWKRYPAEEAAYRRDLEMVRSQVDAATWAAAWEEGRKMTLEQAVEYALAASRDLSGP